MSESSSVIKIAPNSKQPGDGGNGGNGSDVEKLADAKPEVDEAEENFRPKTLKFWTIMISIFLALFLVALDRTIVGTAIPQITIEFNSLGDIGWYGSAYQLTTSASQLVFGRVYRFYDTKKVFLCCVAVFEIGSAICGAAPNSIALILGRAIAGFGGAGIFSGSQIIMIPMIPLRKRPMFQGVFGVVFGLASVMGPLVGGAFTTVVTWRWCFYINLPIGAAAALFLVLFLKVKSTEKPPTTAWEQFVRLDPLGTFFFIPSIVSLLLALQWGGSTYDWNSSRIIALFVVFAVLFLAFAAVQVISPDTAAVPPRVIMNRSIAAGTIFMFAIAGSMLMTIYFLPLWFQVVQGVSAVQSGINTLPFVLSLVAASILSGGITQKIGYYVPAMLICPSVMAVGQGLMSTFRVGENSAHWIGYEFISGFGLGIGMQASSLAAQAVLPKPDIPTGISIMFFAQQLGGAIFTSVGQNLLSNMLVQQISAQGIPGLDASSITTEGADLVSKVPAQYRGMVLDIYNHSITRIFLAGMGISLVGTVAALFMEWKNLKKTGPKAPAALKSSGDSKDIDTTAGLALTQELVPQIPKEVVRPSMEKEEEKEQVGRQSTDKPAKNSTGESDEQPPKTSIETLAEKPAEESVETPVEETCRPLIEKAVEELSGPTSAKSD